ncbi:MAG: hypothetical protein LQ343_003497 [Gyalolechia ehrenbergii]|nr:MAG: hypothetical protein LQ343_003497 [Gyalolechia ehrenbergii]
MASQPPASRQQLSQQAEPSPTANTPSSQLGQSSPSHSTYSEDSQTVILNTSTSEEVPPEATEAKDEPKRPLQWSQTSSSATESKKCWICFSDETEDTSTTAEWRSPCPCALTAHESCLLDWIADKESSPQNGSSRPQKIECPQCKAEILISRPRSRIVEWHQSLQDAAGRLFWPGIIGSLVSGMGAACVLHGASTVYLLLGTRDAETLLGVRNGRMPNSNTILGLASIPGILMISSTTIADPLLPVLPILYFATNRPTGQSGRLWPPSAAMTLVALPYVRAAYRGLRKKIFQEREKEWTRQIQPRGGEDRDNANEGEQEQAPPENEQGGGMNFELGVELEIVEEEEVPFEPGQQEEPVNERPAGEPGAGGGEQRQDLNQQQQPRQGPAQDARPDQGNRDPGLHAEQHRVVRLVPLVSAIVHTMIGALAFPAVAAGMGGLISIFLPRTWRTPPSLWDRRPLGFLQSRFGRSVVGGCLFLFFKDTISLYSKYRLAQDHLHRRVLDYDRHGRKASAS